MQELYKCEEVEMNRDMDLVRDLLVAIANDPRFDGTRCLTPTQPEDLGITDHSREEVYYHLTMLIEAGFIKGKVGVGVPGIFKLSWEGHEFVDNIKDSGIWASTKARVAELPGVAIAVVAELAKAEIKKKFGL